MMSLLQVMQNFEGSLYGCVFSLSNVLLLLSCKLCGNMTLLLWFLIRLKSWMQEKRGKEPPPRWYVSVDELSSLSRYSSTVSNNDWMMLNLIISLWAVSLYCGECIHALMKWEGLFCDLVIEGVLTFTVLFLIQLYERSSHTWEVKYCYWWNGYICDWKC